MSGLDKIIGHITEEASEKAAAILAEADRKAEAVKKDTIRRTAAEVDRIEKKAEAEAVSIGERAEASAALRKKQILLSGKQEIIGATVKMAADRIAALSGREYEDFLTAVFKKHLPKQDAELVLSEKARKLLSEETLRAFAAEAAENGSRLTVSEKDAPVSDGFILDYGGIEDNCSPDALLSQSMEEIQDLVNRKLFTQQ